MTEIQLPQELECKRCGHKWLPRQANVHICPKCKSPYWNVPKKNKKKPQQPMEAFVGDIEQDSEGFIQELGGKK